MEGTNSFTDFLGGRILKTKLEEDQKELRYIYKKFSRLFYAIFPKDLSEKEFEELWAKEKPLEYFKYAFFMCIF